MANYDPTGLMASGAAVLFVGTAMALSPMEGPMNPGIGRSNERTERSRTLTKGQTDRIELVASLCSEENHESAGPLGCDQGESDMFGPLALSDAERNLPVFQMDMVGKNERLVCAPEDLSEILF